MTLPLIYALSKASWLEKRRIIRLIRSESENPDSVREVVSFVRSSGGLGYAESKMKEFAESALSSIQPLPASQAKESLISLVEFTINRKN